MKKFYNSPKLECIILSASDLITASFLTAEDDSVTNGKFGDINALEI